MKTRHLKSTLAILTATLTLGLYNNFEFASWNVFQPAIGKVNEASRVSHAKELLGSHYKGSSAQSLEGKKALNYSLFNKVQSHLPAKWKGQAQSITEAVITESTKYHLDPVFVLAVIKTESRFNPLARGQFGEIGLMQIKPDTAEWMSKKFNIPWDGSKTLENPEMNIRIGLAYMHYLRGQFPGKAQKYVSAYNMGPRNVKRLIAQNIKPAEYSSRVMKNYSEIYKMIAVTKVTPLVASN
ncbi:Soluble lytic murein transglycosylase precursor [compost metagenome]